MAANKHWVKGVTAGLDHGALHRALGIPEKEKIPLQKLEAAAHSKGKLGQEARFALTLRNFHPKSGGKK